MGQQMSAASGRTLTVQDRAESPSSFFLFLLTLYDRIVTSLQLTVDHLAEPEMALQNLSSLHKQAH